MKFLLIFSFLLSTLTGLCQLKCVDVVERFDPPPHKLLNDSLNNLVSIDQIEKLRNEQNLIFTFNVELGTGTISQLRMNYFFEPTFANGEDPLEPKLIELLESFFSRNMKVILKNYSSDSSNITIDCAFTVHVETRNSPNDKNFILNTTEISYLKSAMRKRQKEFDLRNKKIGFISGAGFSPLNKEEFIKFSEEMWISKGEKLSASLIILTDIEKIDSGGFDAFFLTPTKLFTAKHREMIVEILKKEADNKL